MVASLDEGVQLVDSVIRRLSLAIDRVDPIDRLSFLAQYRRVVARQQVLLRSHRSPGLVTFPDSDCLVVLQRGGLSQCAAESAVQLEALLSELSDTLASRSKIARRAWWRRYLGLQLIQQLVGSLMPHQLPTKHIIMGQRWPSERVRD